MIGMGTAAEQIAAFGGREKAFDAVWRTTRQDYRGHRDGFRSLMSHAKYGGRLVNAETITDAELAERLADARAADAKRLGLRRA